MNGVRSHIRLIKDMKTSPYGRKHYLNYLCAGHVGQRPDSGFIRVMKIYVSYMPLMEMYDDMEIVNVKGYMRRLEQVIQKHKMNKSSFSLTK